MPLAQLDPRPLLVLAGLIGAGVFVTVWVAFWLNRVVVPDKRGDE